MRSLCGEDTSLNPVNGGALSPQAPNSHNPQGFTVRKTEAPLQMEGIENWGSRGLQAPWAEVPTDRAWRPAPFDTKSGHDKEQLSRLSL